MFFFFLDGTALDSFDVNDESVNPPDLPMAMTSSSSASRYLPGQVPQTEAATADIEKLSLGGVMGDWKRFMITFI